MEFIPLEKDTKKVKNKQKLDKTKKSENDVEKKITSKKVPNKAFPKKNVKNKYKETLALKKKTKVPKKKKKTEDESEEDEKEEDMDVDNNVSKEEKDIEEEVEEEEEDEEEDEDEVEDEEDERVKEEEAFKRKCQKLDEKKKNRLFIKLQKKIKNEAQVKELHPDIRSVIFPRKKNSRWCWAVFASEERADEALQKLLKNKDVFASKPTPHIKVEDKRKARMKTIARKKETRKKLQEMWL